LVAPGGRGISFTNPHYIAFPSQILPEYSMKLFSSTILS
jgi:hypothetical protein